MVFNVYRENHRESLRNVILVRYMGGKNRSSNEGGGGLGETNTLCICE
jgi:hypothetical protein